MDEKVIPHLVARFLSWKLPHDFRPDAGISFVPEYNNGTPEGGRHEPSGTNLLNAEQAFAMFRHVLEHPAVSAMPERELLREALEALDALIKASSHIHHWHDGHDGGMVVSGSHVHALWEETDRARAAADKIRAALEQQKGEPKP